MDFSSKLLKRVRFGIGADVKDEELMEATTYLFNYLLGLKESGTNVIHYKGDTFETFFQLTDGTKVYDLLESDHNELREFYFMIEDLPVGYVREEEIEWEGTNIFEIDIPITPVLFRFVKTAEGEGFIEWQKEGYTWIIEFHNPEHAFDGLPEDMQLLKNIR